MGLFMQTETLPPCVKRWSADSYPYPTNPSPKVATPTTPAHRRAVVIESLTGHIVHSSGRTVTVQDQRGRRYHGVADDALTLNTPVRFDIAADAEMGSRLTVAVNIVALAE
jgi:hypothetical protein